MSPNRLSKKAHLRRWIAGYPSEMGALAAAYLQYAWTQRTGYPGLWRAALHLDLFEQPV